MGRSGGGGGRSGGSSSGGGSRGSSGRSSSAGRSASSSSSRSSASRSGYTGGGYRPTHPRPRIYTPAWRPRYGYTYAGSRYRTYRHGSSSSLLATLVTIVILLFIIFTIFGAFSSVGGSGVTKSTIEREALPKGLAQGSDYLTDELDWINSKTILQNGMKNFQSKTGVQPYLYITDYVNGSYYPSAYDMETYAMSLYDELFTDEAHLILLFWENNNNYKTWVITGSQAKTVVDQEGIDILLDYVDRYYYSDMDEDEFFAKSFNDAAVRMMKVEKSPVPKIIISIVLLAVVIILFRWWKAVQDEKREASAQAERILNAPLEELGSGGTGLEDKYN